MRRLVEYPYILLLLCLSAGCRNTSDRRALVSGQVESPAHGQAKPEAVAIGHSSQSPSLSTIREEPRTERHGLFDEWFTNGSLALHLNVLEKDRSWGVPAEAGYQFYMPTFTLRNDGDTAVLLTEAIVDFESPRVPRGSSPKRGLWQFGAVQPGEIAAMLAGKPGPKPLPFAIEPHTAYQFSTVGHFFSPAAIAGRTLKVTLVSGDTVVQSPFTLPVSDSQGEVSQPVLAETDADRRARPTVGLPTELRSFREYSIADSESDRGGLAPIKAGVPASFAGKPLYAGGLAKPLTDGRVSIEVIRTETRFAIEWYVVYRIANISETRGVRIRHIDHALFVRAGVEGHVVPADAGVVRRREGGEISKAEGLTLEPGETLEVWASLTWAYRQVDELTVSLRYDDDQASVFSITGLRRLLALTR